MAGIASGCDSSQRRSIMRMQSSTKPPHAESGFLALFRSVMSGLSQPFHNPLTEELPCITGE